MRYPLILTPLALAAALVGCASSDTANTAAPDPAADLAADNARLTRQIESLRAELSRLENRLAAEGKTGLAAELRTLREENEDLRARNEQLEQLAGVTAEGDPVASAEARFETIYDPDADRTLVRTEPSEVDLHTGSRDPHYFSIAYSHPGKRLTAADRPDTLTVFLQTRRTGGRYRSADRIVFDAGGTELAAEVVGYDAVNRVSSTGGKGRRSLDDETITARLDTAQWRTLANAAEVRGSLGGTVFDLTPQQVALIRAARERVRVTGGAAGAAE